MERKTLLIMMAMVSLSLMMGGCGKKEKKAPVDQDQAKKADDAVESKDVKDVEEKVKEAAKSLAAEAPVKVPEVIASVKAPAVKELVKAPIVKESVKALVAGKAAKSPWADAKVGTMSKLKSMGGTFIVSEVIKADPKSVTVKMTFLGADGKAMAGVKPHEMVFQREYSADTKEAKSRAEMENNKVGTKTITVAGQSFTCTIFEMITEQGGKKITTRSYYCPDVPGGVVLVESDAMGTMQTMSELIDFKK